MAIAFCLNTNLLASSSEDASIKIWDLTSFKCVFTLLGHMGPVVSLVFAQIEQGAERTLFLASGSSDKTVKLWDVQFKKGVLIKTLKGHSAEVKALFLNSIEKEIVSGSADLSVKVWDLKGNCKSTFIFESSPFDIISFSPQNTYFLTCHKMEKNIYIWNYKLQRQVAYFSTKKGVGVITCAVFSNDGNLVICGSDDSNIYIWDVNDNTNFRVFSGHSAKIAALSIHPKVGCIISSSYDGKVKIWRCSHNLFYLEILKDPQSLIAGLKLYNTDTTNQLIQDNTSLLNSTIFPTHQKLPTGNMLYILGPCSAAFKCLAVNLASSLIISGQASSIKIWDALSGELLT